MILDIGAAAGLGREYLYNSGDQCSDVTGGWLASTKLDTATAATQSGKLTLNSTNMVASIAYVTDTCQAGGKIVTKNTVDVTGYTTLHIECSYSETESGEPLSAIFGLFETDVACYPDSVAQKELTTTTSNAAYSIDISDVTGKYYVGVYLGWSNFGGSASSTIKMIYIE